MATLSQTTNPYVDKLRTISQAKGFLGREFLTWLWCKVETTSGPLSIKAQDPAKELAFNAWIDDHVSLEAPSASVREHVLRGGDPSHSREATLALVSGKMVKGLKLGLQVDGIGSFTVTLSGDDLAARSLRLPEDSSASHGRGASSHSGSQRDDHADDVISGHTERRLEQLALYHHIIDRLFQKFMHERLADNWATDGAARIRGWIERRSEGQKLHVIH